MSNSNSETEEHRWRGSVEATLISIDKNQTAFGLQMEKAGKESDDSRRRMYKAIERVGKTTDNAVSKILLLDQKVDNHVADDKQKFGWILKAVLWVAGGGTLVTGAAKMSGIIP